jgi:GNAT superfamily N-acetyltransferase
VSALAIRFGRPDERASLEDLQRRASLMWDEYRPYLLANPDVIELPLAQLREDRVRVAEWQGRAAGFAALLPKDGFCELDGLFVEPRLWGHGIARALVADALVLARATGARAIETIANPRAEGFYMKQGFVVTSRAETQFGPANRMRIFCAPSDRLAGAPAPCRRTSPTFKRCARKGEKARDSAQT